MSRLLRIETVMKSHHPDIGELRKTKKEVSLIEPNCWITIRHMKQFRHKYWPISNWIPEKEQGCWLWQMQLRHIEPWGLPTISNGKIEMTRRGPTPKVQTEPPSKSWSSHGTGSRTRTKPWAWQNKLTNMRMINLMIKDHQRLNSFIIHKCQRQALGIIQKCHHNRKHLNLSECSAKTNMMLHLLLFLQNWAYSRMLSHLMTAPGFNPENRAVAAPASTGCHHQSQHHLRCNQNSELNYRQTAMPVPNYLISEIDSNNYLSEKVVIKDKR